MFYAILHGCIFNCLQMMLIKKKIFIFTSPNEKHLWNIASFSTAPTFDYPTVSTYCEKNIQKDITFWTSWEEQKLIWKYISRHIYFLVVKKKKALLHCNMMISDMERRLFSKKSKYTHTQNKDRHWPTRKDWTSNI